MAVTNVSLALQLLEQEFATKQPNVGMYQEDTAPGQSAVPAANVVAVWIQGQPEDVDFVDMAPQTAADSNSDVGLVDVNATACLVAYFDDYCTPQYGGSLAAIQTAYAANPDMMPSALMGAPSWNQFLVDMSNVGWQQNNDPFGSMGVVFPQPQTIEQKIVADVDAAEGVTPTAAQESAAEAAVAADLQPGPGLAKKK